MEDTSRSEYEPLLANSEARERAARLAKKNKVMWVVGIVFVAALVVTTAALVTTSKHRIDVLDTGDVAIRLFQTDWDNFGKSCVSPPIPTTYDSAQLSGLWYEVAKIQTPAAAIIQEGCSCSTMSIEFASDSIAQTLMRMKCRDVRAGGADCGALAVMNEQDRRGHWIQNLYGENINWYVILQTNSMLLTYDCTISYEDEVEYSIHLYSRTRHPQTEPIATKLDSVIQFYGAFLNPLNVPTVRLEQNNCENPLIKEDNSSDDYKQDRDDVLFDLDMDFLYD